MYLECNCLLNSLITLLFFFSKKKNTVTKNSKILLKYSHFMKPYRSDYKCNIKCATNDKIQKFSSRFFGKVPFSSPLIVKK